MKDSVGSVAAIGIATAVAPRTATAIAPAVVVIGAGGKTGQQCVESLRRRGKRVAAAIRQAGASDDSDSIVARVTADVTKPETLDAAFKGAAAVIFAASASKSGGTAEERL